MLAAVVVDIYRWNYPDSHFHAGLKLSMYRCHKSFAACSSEDYKISRYSYSELLQGCYRSSVL